MNDDLEHIWARHAWLANATREAVRAMGLTIFAQTPCNVLTSINVPAGIRYYSVYDGNMPNKVYISEIPVPVMNNDIGLIIRSTPKGLVLQTP